MDAPEFGGFNVMLHVANKESFRGGQFVFRQHFQDFGPLVPNAQIGPLDVLLKTRRGRLQREIIPDAPC